LIGIDTNVLVRYLTQDDVAQSAVSSRLFEVDLTEENQGFLGHVVLVETAWVLQRAYGVSAADVRLTIRDLLDTRNLVIERRDVVAHALALAESSECGFADAMIAAAARVAGCRRVVSFDRGARKAGMELL
jgi:predicted nucleic-acid-binding protein